jgi:hypothetical protein
MLERNVRTMRYVYSMKIEPFRHEVFTTCTPSQAFFLLNLKFKRLYGISVDPESYAYTIKKHFELKHVKDMPGFDRKCYKSKEKNPRYFVYQDGKWYHSSKDYEPSHEMEEWNK